MLFKTNAEPPLPCAQNTQRTCSIKYRGWEIDVDQVTVAGKTQYQFSAERKKWDKHSMERDRFATVQEIRAYVQGRIDEVMMQPESIHS